MADATLHRTGISPVLSVVIVTWNSEQEIGACLDSVTVAAGDRAVEIVVVDNGSTDRTVGVVRAHPSGARLLPLGRNLGFAAANNHGIRRTRGPFVLLLNPDTIVEPNALGSALRHMRANPRIGVLGARLLTTGGTVQQPCVTAHRSLWDEVCTESGLYRLIPGSRLFDRHRMLYHDFDRSSAVDTVAGAFLFLRRAALAETGLLDEELFLYGEEEDLCRRLSASGWVVWYAADVTVTHLGGRSTSRAPHDVRTEYWRSRDYVTAKHSSAMRTACVRALRTVGMLRRILGTWLRVARGRLARGDAAAATRHLWSSMLLQLRPLRRRPPSAAYPLHVERE